MASSFECEVRFRIPSIDRFKEKMKELGAKIIFDYEFTDHYYLPSSGGSWNLSKKNLRLREWKKPESKCEILFSELETLDIDGLKFKRSILKDGKLCLYQSSFENCKKLLESLDFVKWFSLKKKDCTLYDIPKYNFKTISESIPNFGWTGELEVEGNKPQEAVKSLKKQIKILGLKEQDVSSEPISLMYAKSMGLLNKISKV